jgi:aerobic-type carbon monoxide dehydrogenase small subunit (CoxS/CutS family)
MEKTIRFTLNGRPTRLAVEGRRGLLWVLRSDLGLSGTKYGCGEGLCGACTVMVGKEALRSCLLPVQDVAGKEVLTIEGLAKNGELHPLQKAFMEHDALQCGYCTPGMILNAYGLLLRNPEPDLAEIISAMEDNLCRCGAHQRIIRAIESTAQVMKGGSK